MRWPVALLVALACATPGSVLVHSAASHTTPPASPSWRLVWGDEFDGAGLNASVWDIRNNESHCCGARGTDELELYLDSQVHVRDGLLHLQTQRRTVVGPKRGGGTQLFHYVSGWVDTKPAAHHPGFAQLHGRFAANCSLPPRKATGIWPAFWLMPTSTQCWPTGGEIDIFEMNGDPLQDLVWGSYHWAEPKACGKDREPIPGRGHKPSGAHSDWQTGWHVYAVEWTPEKIDFYIDDTLYLTRTRDPIVLPSAPMYVIFDQAVDQDIFSPSPTDPAYDGAGVELRVDWVRVYEAETQRHG